MNSPSFFNNLLAFIKYRFSLLLFYTVSAGIVLLVQYLSGQEMLYARYIVLLMGFFLCLILLVDFLRFTRRRRALHELMAGLYTLPRELPAPLNALDADYSHMIAELGAAYDALKARSAAARSDQLEYYTLWVHQIKTPIAALTLVLSNMDTEQAGVMKQELFKIERYADLALRYIKLSDISLDLLIERCSLQDIVRECVKKFGLLIVYKRLSVSIDPIDAVVLSDRRWLSFVIEQVLSNAVKYTQSGGIRIRYQNNKLVVEDTGIGIREEDIPRIFAKGYTGFNGRMDTRASGIGLYLAKKAADALNIRMQVQSRVGEGTEITILLPTEEAILYT